MFLGFISFGFYFKGAERSGTVISKHSFRAPAQRVKMELKNSVAGTWTRVSRVRAEYPNQLDYNGLLTIL